jgi:OmcA/MtrC family decaheme c-type cytochrome
MLKKSLKFFLFALMLVAAVSMFGCGSDGDTGPQGPPGEDGTTTVVEVPFSAGAETCTICHSEDKIAAVADFHPQVTDQTLISDIVVTNSAAGLPTVDFHVELTDGTPVEGIQNEDFRFMMADLVPAGTATAQGTWDTPYYERWAYERISDGYDFGTLTDNTGGDYTYEFATAFGSVGPQSTPADDIDPTPAGHPQRLMIRVQGQDGTNRTASFLDFTVPTNDGTTPAPVLDPQRQYVTAGACKECHGPQFERAAHAGGYYDTLGCVMCHSPLGHYGDLMQTDFVYFGPMAKQIHIAYENEAFVPPEEGRPIINGYTNPDGLDLYSWADVAFPQDIANCVVCHNDEGSLVPTEVDNWKTEFSIENCTGCHIIRGVNIETGEGHAGGPQTDVDGCSFCHNGGLAPTNEVAHDTTPTGMDVPEFVVDIQITPDQAVYAVGDVLQIRVTLTQDDQPVDSSIYTAAQDGKGNAGGGLSEADVRIYGPRARALPVLATGSTTDPNYDSAVDTPVQAHALFVGDSDPQVNTDATGFGYQTLPITADMEPGTYMVRFEGGDYGAVSDTDFVTHSTALKTFQVVDPDEELKVAGDGCLNCHGDTRMHLRGAHPHNAAFNTDECLACHDLSGNYGVPIANRVHAVHFANPFGDIIVFNRGTAPEDRPWFEISFPRDIDPEDSSSGCIACHTSDKVTYLTLPYQMPCAGCHVGDPDNPAEAGVLSHMLQNGGPYNLYTPPPE